jgi:Na+-driven multidrug efflux pump
VARNAWIVCNDCQKYLKYVYVSAAISNVILNRILIPVWGSSGAALASLIAQVITIMVVPFFIKPLRENLKLMMEAILLKGIKK